MNHSYEELRDTTIELLSGKEKSRSGYGLEQFDGLKAAVAEVFARREGRQGSRFELSSAESELLRQVFWDLFRQGIVIPGHMCRRQQRRESNSIEETGNNVQPDA